MCSVGRTWILDIYSGIMTRTPSKICHFSAYFSCCNFFLCRDLAGTCIRTNVILSTLLFHHRVTNWNRFLYTYFTTLKKSDETRIGSYCHFHDIIKPILFKINHLFYRLYLECLLILTIEIQRYRNRDMTIKSQ